MDQSRVKRIIWDTLEPFMSIFFAIRIIESFKIKRERKREGKRERGGVV